MIVVGAMGLAIWFAGVATGAPRQARLLMLGILLVGVLMLHVVLPDGHPLREATGRDPRLWLLLVAGLGLAVGYLRLLSRVRAEATARQTPATPPARPAQFSDAELSRYARHVALREVGGMGQRRLRDARVLVVGAGGLGAPSLLYLAASGVGTLGVIDDDRVESSNLQRQVLFRDNDLGRPKTEAAADALHAQNPFVAIRPYNRRLSEEIAESLFRDYDLVLDGTDGWDTRALANRAAVAAGVPLLAGAIAQWDGQVALWDPARRALPRLRLPRGAGAGPRALLRGGGRRGAAPRRHRHRDGARGRQAPHGGGRVLARPDAPLGRPRGGGAHRGGGGAARLPRVPRPGPQEGLKPCARPLPRRHG